MQEAERLKQEGNNHFRSKAWEEALAQYKSALGHLPRRKREPLREPVEPPEVAEISTPEALPATPPQPRNEESLEIVKARAILNANVGACYVQLVSGHLFFRFLFTPAHRRENIRKLSKHARKVVLEDHLPRPMRLMEPFDSVGGRSTLYQGTPTTSCLKRDNRIVVCADQCSRRYYERCGVTLLTLTRSIDYRTLLSLLPESSTQRPEINRTLRDLEPRIEDQRKKETGEMMGKLKELGNTFLGSSRNESPWMRSDESPAGNFGLSTDNFKFEPNGQGGYSVNFSR